jgi:hypothetical protein
VALKLRRWILAAIVGWGLIFVAYQPTGELPESAEPYYGPRIGATPERRRADALGAAFARARMELAVAQRRDTLLASARARPTSSLDSLYAAAAGGPRSAGPSLQITFPASPAARRALNQAFAAVWDELAPLDTTVRVVALVRNSYGLNTYLLPYGTDGRTCVASLLLDWQLRRLARPKEEPPPRELIVDFFRDNLGACAYYAAFGQPGRAIERWLESRSFDLAGQATWASPSPPSPAPEASTAALFDRLIAGGDARYGASFDALGCASGEPGACRRALFEGIPTSPNRYRPRMRGVVLDRAFFSEGRGFYGGRGYLADLVREIGRERFIEFWRSPLPPDSAFAAATGQSIERWTAHWERGRLHGMMFRNRVPLAAVLLSLLVAGAVIAGGAAAVTRRRVG